MAWKRNRAFEKLIKMSRFGKVLAVLAAIAVIVVLGVVVGLRGGAKPSPDAASQSNEGPDPAASTGTARVAPIIESTPPRIARGSNNNISKSPPGVVAATTTNGIPDWEEKIDAILTSEVPDNEKAKKMLEMFPQLSPEAQEEVAHHLSNLVPDEEYAPLGNYLTNSALPEAVLDVLLEDVFNRPNSVKLPRLLDIASNPQHPKASESKDVLELFLEEDYGTDWEKWRGKMDQWLKDNPD